MLGPFRFSLYDTRVLRKSLSLPMSVGMYSSAKRLLSPTFVKYVLRAAPVNTPMRP